MTFWSGKAWQHSKSCKKCFASFQEHCSGNWLAWNGTRCAFSYTTLLRDVWLCSCRAGELDKLIPIGTIARAAHCLGPSPESKEPSHIQDHCWGQLAAALASATDAIPRVVFVWKTMANSCNHCDLVLLENDYTFRSWQAWYCSCFQLCTFIESGHHRRKAYIRLHGICVHALWHTSTSLNKFCTLASFGKASRRSGNLPPKPDCSAYCTGVLPCKSSIMTEGCQIVFIHSSGSSTVKLQWGMRLCWWSTLWTIASKHISA